MVYMPHSEEVPVSDVSHHRRVAGVILLCLAEAVHGQNLLTNGHVEGVDGFVIPPGSCAPPGGENWFYRYNCIPEIEPPSWWLPFWNSGPTPVDPDTNYRRPEYRIYARPDGSHYAHQGQRYLVFFGFYGAIDAGMYQQVSGVTQGQLYEFSYQGFAWSNCLDGKEGVSGDGCHDFPPDQAVFTAGIDPYGGTDYTSPDIVWSSGATIYDAYDEVSVRTAAQSATVTVFVRCTFWHNHVQHNDAHVDALQLVRAGPMMQVSPNRFTRSVNPVAPLAPDSFTVQRSGGDGAMTYTISDNAAWLSTNPSSGSSDGEADLIAVHYSVGTLAAGTYNATITVTSPEADNSPQRVAVRLEIVSVRPDLDGDGDVDLDDFGCFQRCMTWPGEAKHDPVCLTARLDGDEDVDGDDFAVFLKCLSGKDVPADLACDD